MAIAVAAMVAAAVPPWPPASTRELAKGKFLIARPHAGGPVFHESVVLLLEYGSDGAMGLIINRPTEIALAQLFPDVETLQGRSDRTFFGGPVEPHRVMLLFRSSDPPPESRRVARGIHVAGSFEVLRTVVESADPESRYRVYVGYAGWAMGQLEGEVARGDWLIAPSDASAVFEMDPEKVWQEFIDRSSGLQADRRRLRVPAADGTRRAPPAV
jgi:putative transcriptional regulator